jgi:ribulose-5-phosphate 4-epimerase/fuculose-1-phosphate aldolase
VYSNRCVKGGCIHTHSPACSTCQQIHTHTHTHTYTHPDAHTSHAKVLPDEGVSSASTVTSGLLRADLDKELTSLVALEASAKLTKWRGDSSQWLIRNQRSLPLHIDPTRLLMLLRTRATAS